jgi:pimeloyl-ACP methyl ester carboxylesterase
VIESVRIKTDGATLAVRHFPGAGDPIVLLHGGPGMGDYFGSFPEVLSPPYSVVSYNQRGCGPSFCEGSFDVEEQVADLDAIRTHFAADRIHIFGHSWGGLLGQLYAKTHPQHVASLVLCCSMANTGRRVAALESKCIAERVIAKPKRSPLAWVFAGTLMQFPGRLERFVLVRRRSPWYFSRRRCHGGVFVGSPEAGCARVRSRDASGGSGGAV